MVHDLTASMYDHKTSASYKKPDSIEKNIQIYLTNCGNKLRGIYYLRCSS